MSVEQKIQEVYQAIGEGKALDAFESHYHENVVMIEGDNKRFEGKDVNRKREHEWFGNVANVHGAGVDGMTANEEQGVTMVESWMDVEFKDGSRIKMEQVARQKWQDGQIIEERFYYNPGNFGG